MLIVIFVLIYLQGICNQFGALLRLDQQKARVAPLIDYSLLALFWPITIWWWMYSSYELAHKRLT